MQEWLAHSYLQLCRCGEGLKTSWLITGIRSSVLLLQALCIPGKDAPAPAWSHRPGCQGPVQEEAEVLGVVSSSQVYTLTCCPHGSPIALRWVTSNPETPSLEILYLI